MHEAVLQEAEFAAADAATLRERVVVAPRSGRFSPLPPDHFTSEGEWVEPGQALGEITADGASVPVTSPFRGWVKGMLVMDGQPVGAGQALFWIWSS